MRKPRLLSEQDYVENNMKKKFSKYPSGVNMEIKHD